MRYEDHGVRGLGKETPSPTLIHSLGSFQSLVAVRVAALAFPSGAHVHISCCPLVMDMA